MTATQYAFSDSNDLSSVCQKAADENDALYVPTDNTVAANTGIVDGICRPAKKPVFAGEEGICSGCGVATLSISYYDLGYTTGEMAVKILNGESDISTMPIEYTDVTKKYNKAICDDLWPDRTGRLCRDRSLITAKPEQYKNSGEEWILALLRFPVSKREIKKCNV